MTAPLSDILLLLSMGGSISLVAIFGVIVLPWRDQELADTRRAVGAAWILAERQMKSGLPAAEAPPAEAPAQPAVAPLPRAPRAA